MTRPVERLTYTVPEAAAVIGVSAPTVRILIGRGDMPALRIGRRILISKLELAAWLERNANATHDGWHPKATA